MRRAVRILLMMVMGALLVGSLASCASNQEDEFADLDDFAHARLGVQIGSSWAKTTVELYPEAEVTYFALTNDMITAVDQGKIDGFLIDEPFLASMVWEGLGIRAVEEPAGHADMGFAFCDDMLGRHLAGQMNDFLAQLEANGTLDELQEKWLGSEEPLVHPDLDAPSGENGTLRLAISSDTKPLSYMKDDIATGLEVELFAMFAERYGYAVECEQVSFETILPGIATGRYDAGAAGFTITEERSESMAFSNPYMSADVLMVVKSTASAESFGAFVKEGLEKTFMRDNRWKLFVQGVFTTIIITAASAFLGTLLGFGIYLLTRSENRLVASVSIVFARAFKRLVDGLPAVVILMVLFYVIFGSFSPSGVMVAILGFTVTFGAFVYGLVRTCVAGVDSGQAEAAYALGYGKSRAFFRVVLPQAAKMIFPTWCDEAVELMKGTAVVGYIAVADLTGVADLVRSTTYDAFFPLLTISIAYFFLTWCMTSGLRYIQRRFGSSYRTPEQILSGVKRHDCR